MWICQMYLAWQWVTSKLCRRLKYWFIQTYDRSFHFNVVLVSCNLDNMLKEPMSPFLESWKVDHVNYHQLLFVELYEWHIRMMSLALFQLSRLTFNLKQRERLYQYQSSYKITRGWCPFYVILDTPTLLHFFPDFIDLCKWMYIVHLLNLSSLISLISVGSALIS